MKWSNKDIAAAIMATVFVLTTANPVFAENWVRVSNNKRVYIDLDSISINGQYTSVVVQWDKSLDSGPLLEINNKIAFDCVRNKFKFTGQEIKQRDGTIVYNNTHKNLYQDTSRDEIWRAISSSICPP